MNLGAGLVGYYNVTLTAVNRTSVTNIIVNSNGTMYLTNNVTMLTHTVNPFMVGRTILCSDVKLRAIRHFPHGTYST